MALREKVLGLKDLERDLGKVAAVVVKPQAGIADSLQVGVQIVVDEARRNVWELFDTSGDFPSRIKVRRVNQYRVDLVVDAVYAKVHEYGGTFTITAQQRRFFWAKWYETNDEMWKALALSTRYTIPPRPYVRPAIDTKREEAIEVAAEDLADRIAAAV